MKIISYFLMTVCLFIGGTSCTKEFDEINTDKSAIAKITLNEAKYIFAKGQSTAVITGDIYQVGINLFADLYAQYWANATTYFSTDRFFINTSWIDQVFPSYYTDPATSFTAIFENTDPNSAEYALANVMWVYLFHNVTDQYGPIPYFQVSEALESVPYDAQDKIYDDFFKRLDAVNKVLKTKSGQVPFGNFDLIYAGDLNKWIMFANSLRLRLALRISKVDPARAKVEAEAAVAAGVFLNSPDDDALIKRTTDDYNYNNHLSTMSEWGEFGMSASMESFLKGYGDPRMPILFSPTKNSVINGTPEYHGIRNGLLATDFNDSTNKLANNSIAGPRWNLNVNAQANSTSQNVMSTAEAYFLRAEGALNGWNMGGNAKELYEAGITNSFKQWGVDPSVTNGYLNNSATPVALNDYLNSPAVSNIPVKFSLTEAIQREQIGTQKWIAMFPDGFAGWAENRRTGFPKLYPVPNSVNPDIPAGGIVRRLPFAQYEYTTNKKGVEIGLTLLGGPDNAATRVWWDKN